MSKNVRRETVDLSKYPDLVVIELGMQVNSIGGILTLLKVGFQIQKSVEAKPDGLLNHVFCLYSLTWPHVGIRQYWQDFESLEKWTREQPHKGWWAELMRNTKGTGFWHEVYSRAGNFEGVYLNTNAHPLGFQTFAPASQARGSKFSSRGRLGLTADSSQPTQQPVVEESTFYDS